MAMLTLNGDPYIIEDSQEKVSGEPKNITSLPKEKMPQQPGTPADSASINKPISEFTPPPKETGGIAVSGQSFPSLQEAIAKHQPSLGTQSRAVTASVKESGQKTHTWIDPADQEPDNNPYGIFYRPEYDVSELEDQRWDPNASIFVDQRLFNTGVGKLRAPANTINRSEFKSPQRLKSDREYLEILMGRVLNNIEEQDHKRLQALRATHLAANHLMKMATEIPMGNQHFTNRRVLFKLAVVDPEYTDFMPEELEMAMDPRSGNVPNYYPSEGNMAQYMLNAPSAAQSYDISPEDLEQYYMQQTAPEATMGYAPEQYAPEQYSAMYASPEQQVYNYNQMYAAPPAQEQAPVQEIAPSPAELQFQQQLQAYRQGLQEIVTYLQDMGYSPEEAAQVAPQLLAQVQITRPEMPKTAGALRNLYNKYRPTSWSREGHLGPNFETEAAHLDDLQAALRNTRDAELGAANLRHAEAMGKLEKAEQEGHMHEQVASLLRQGRFSEAHNLLKETEFAIKGFKPGGIGRVRGQNRSGNSTYASLESILQGQGAKIPKELTQEDHLVLRTLIENTRREQILAQTAATPKKILAQATKDQRTAFDAADAAARATRNKHLLATGAVATGLGVPAAYVGWSANREKGAPDSLSDMGYSLLTTNPFSEGGVASNLAQAAKDNPYTTAALVAAPLAIGATAPTAYNYLTSKRKK